MGEVLIPSDIVVFAFVAIDHFLVTRNRVPSIVGTAS